MFPGHLAPPEHIQIFVGSVPGRGCLSPLKLEEPYDIFPLSAGCLPGPQVYVEEHLVPAGDLTFQLDLQSVPLAQKETIHLLLGGFWARRSIEQVVDLAWGPPWGPLF
jgi:hypothetical protein